MPGDEPTTGDGSNADGTDATTSDTETEASRPETPTEVSASDAAADESDADDGFAVSRRKALVGGLGLFVGAGVGASATFATTGQNQVQKTRPNSDGKGTLGELRWILEEKHALTVTSMVVDDDTVRVQYASNADSRGQSRREIGAVISAYGLIVANDGPTEKLSADIERAFDQQATSYFVQADWVLKWRQGDISDAGVAQRVFNTRKFPKGATQN